MTRKLIAMLLCVMMVASIITIPVFADEISYADYVPGEMPANMIKSTAEMGGTSSLAVQFGRAADGRLAYAFVDSYRHYSITANGEAGGPMTGSAPNAAYTNGFYIATGAIKGNGFKKADGTDTGDIAGAKSYVYNIQVKNLNADITPRVHAKIYDYDAGGGSQYSKEHGASGMEVTGTDWVDFKGTIYNKDDTHIEQTINGRDPFSFGFVNDTLAGSSVVFNLSDTREGMHVAYFAEEAAYDIENNLVSNSNIITSKTPATFKAQILNQVGLPGNLNQDAFVWKAMDTDRTAEIPGFIITANGGEAVVTVDDTVEAGQYTIVAYNSEYDMAKGYTITVDAPSPYLDYTPGEIPANLFNSNTASNSSNLQFFTQTKDTVAKVSWDSWTHIRVKSVAAYDGVTKVGLAGYYMPGALVHSKVMADGTIVNDKYYVVDFYAKAAEGSDGVVRDTKVNMGVTNYKYESRLHTTKEYGVDGMPVSTDWKRFSGTIYVEPVHPSYAGQRTAQVSLGLSTTALAGTGVIISDGLKGEPGKVYMAEEVAYDITNEITSGSDTFAAGKTATFKAAVVNQVGLPGYLNQDITWKVLDRETRKVELEGVTITAENGVATLTTTKATQPGEYVVVAYSEANNMAKGVNITIEAPNYYEDYVRGEMPANIFMFSKLQSDMYSLQYCAVMLDGAGEKVNQMIGWSGHTWGWLSKAEYDGTTVVGRVNKNSRIPGGEMRENVMTEYLQNGQGYVVSFKARNRAESAQYPAKVNVAVLNRRTGSGYNYNTEYGAEGFQLEAGTDWQTVKASIYVAPTVDKYDGPDSTHSPLLDIGLSENSLAGTGMDTYYGEDFYLAKEVAYDITNTTSGSTTLINGAQAEFTAQVVNQLEIPGNLIQNIEWKVMNKARTADIDGFVITEGENGAATIKVNGAAPGTYDVVAYSADYKMAKGVEITVKEAEAEVTLITVDDSEEGKFCVCAVEVADTVAEKILVAVASYADVAGAKKVADADKIELTVENGAASLGEHLVIDAAAGSEIRVFVWDAVTLAPIKLAQDVVASFTK